MQNSRPELVTVVAAWQSLIAAVFLYFWLAVALLGSSILLSVLLSTAFWGIPLIVSFLAAKGLWRGTSAGWWIAVVFDLTGLAVAVRSVISDHVNFQNALEFALFFVPLLLLPLPGIRRFCDVPHKPTNLFSS